MIAVSLWTRPVERARLERLYRALHTPVADNEPAPKAPFEVPAGSAPTPTRKIFDHPDFELRYPGRVSQIGFLAAWIGVAALVGFVYWLASG